MKISQYFTTFAPMKQGYNEILALAIPSIITNITIPLLGLADLAIVGHIGDENHIGAIAIATMIFNVMYWVLGFLRMGTSGMTSQAYGAGDWDETLRTLFRALMLGCGMGIVFLVSQSGLAWMMFRVMHTPETALPFVAAYFRIAIWGAPAMLGLYGLSGWFIGMQNTRLPMFIAILQNLVNILASLFFVFKMKWGIEGVAAGTLIAQWAGFIVGLLVLRKKLRTYTFFPVDVLTASLRQLFRSILTNGCAWQRFFVVNRDIFLRTLCLIGVNLFFTRAGAKQGSMLLAVNTLLMTLFTLFSYVMDGFAYAGEALAGKYYGATSYAELRQMVGRLFVFGGVMVVIFTVMYIAGGIPFLQLITDNQAVIVAAQPYVVWAYLVPVAGVAAFIYDGVFIGITETHGMLLSSALAMVVFFVFYFVAFPLLGNDALWIAFLLFLFLRGALQYGWTKTRLRPIFGKMQE